MTAAKSAGAGTWIRRLLLAIGAVAVFGGYTMSVLRNERLLSDGATVRLALAPVDPRALMTGDYMSLDYAVAREAIALERRTSRAQASPEAGSREVVSPRNAWVVVALDDRRIGRFVRVQSGPAPAASGEIALPIRLRASGAQIGTNAWYFQEGTAARYERARFGEFRVDAGGRMLLTRLLDEQLQAL